MASLAYGTGCAGDAETDRTDPAASEATTIDFALVAHARELDPPATVRRPPVTPPTVAPPLAPMVSDLKSDGTMRFYGGAQDLGVQINVVNVGNAPAFGPSGMVNVGSFNATVALYPYLGDAATPPNTLNPGQRGYLIAHLPIGSLTPCTTYVVHIDMTRTMQTGTPDPFVNDEADVATQCLQWGSTVSSDNFNIADPLITGRTLQQIVSSEVVARQDRHLCSYCHFQGSGRAYSPPVAQNGSAVIWPDQVINGRTWAGPGGYARSFLAQPTDNPNLVNSKPSFLQALVQTWIDDGERFAHLPFDIVEVSSGAKLSP